MGKISWALGRLRFWRDGDDGSDPPSFDSQRSNIHLTDVYTGSITLPESTNSSFSAIALTRDYTIAPTLRAGTTFATGMIRFSSGYWGRDWVCVGNTAVVLYKWAPTPASSGIITPILRTMLDLVIESGALILREQIWMEGRAGQGGAFGGGLILPEITVEYQIAVGGFA